MTSTYNAQDLVGNTAVDPDNAKIGKIGQVYLDDQTGQPAWITVSTGLFGTKESFAPLQGSSQSADGDITLAVTKDQVKDAPNIDSDGHIGEDEQSTLYDYYSQFVAGGTRPAGTDHDHDSHDHDSHVETTHAETAQQGGPGHDTSGADTDDAMTRSEEQLHVGTENVETGKARLRKYVVTENVTKTVPVSHEEVRIEREPITDANAGAAHDGPAISEEEHEVTLHAERAVVDKQAVPVERVKLDTETVTEQQTVSEDVRKEQIDIDGDDASRR